MKKVLQKHHSASDYLFPEFFTSLYNAVFWYCFWRWLFYLNVWRWSSIFLYMFLCNFIFFLNLLILLNRSLFSLFYPHIWKFCTSVLYSFHSTKFRWFNIKIVLVKKGWSNLRTNNVWLKEKCSGYYPLKRYI